MMKKETGYSASEWTTLDQSRADARSAGRAGSSDPHPPWPNPVGDDAFGESVNRRSSKWRDAPACGKFGAVN
jgi:hypothetical protein